MEDVISNHNVIENIQGEAVQVGNNNDINATYINNITNIYVNYPSNVNYPEDITNNDGNKDTELSTRCTVGTQTSQRKSQRTEQSIPRIFYDINGNAVQLEQGDTLEVEFDLFVANAIYIGAGGIVCVREDKIVKERLYKKSFCKRRTEFKPGVDVFESSCAVGRAKERVGENFTEGTRIDFVSWCYTGLKRKKACL